MARAPVWCAASHSRNVVCRAAGVNDRASNMRTTARTPEASPGHLARALGISERTARRFISSGRMPAVYALAWAISIEGDIGAVWPEWRGWTIRAGQIHAPEGYSFHPGELRAIPLRAQQIAHLERERLEPRQLLLASP